MWFDAMTNAPSRTKCSAPSTVRRTPASRNTMRPTARAQAESETRPPGGARREGRNRPHQREHPPDPSRVGDLANPSRGPTQGGPRAARREAGEAQPERPPTPPEWRHELPRLVEPGHRAPADLSARGLEHGMWRARAPPRPPADRAVPRTSASRAARISACRPRIGFARLRHRDEAFGAGGGGAGRRMGGEEGHAAAADPREVSRRLLELVRDRGCGRPG